MIRNFSFFLMEALRDFRRRRVSLTISVFCISLLLLFLTFISSICLEMGNVANLLRDEAQVSLFLQENITEQNIKDLMSKVSQFEGVSHVKMISKEEALVRMTEILGGRQDSMQAFEGYNPFMSYLEIGVAPEAGVKVAEEAQNLPGVEWVRDNRVTMEKLTRITTALRFFELLTSIFVGVIIMIVVSHIIHLGIAARKEEMEVYRLLGASEGFVAAPFLLEGGLTGLVSGILSSLAALVLLPLIFTKLQGALPFLPIAPGVRMALLEIPWIIAASILFGTLGSLFALKQS